MIAYFENPVNFLWIGLGEKRMSFKKFVEA